MGTMERENFEKEQLRVAVPTEIWQEKDTKFGN